MWYKCLNPNCGFVFNRTGECKQCPDCGKEILREASKIEVDTFLAEKDEIYQKLNSQ